MGALLTMVMGALLLLGCGVPLGSGGPGGKADVAGDEAGLRALYQREIEQRTSPAAQRPVPTSSEEVQAGFYELEIVHSWPNPACPDPAAAGGGPIRPLYLLSRDGDGLVPPSDAAYEIGRPEAKPGALYAARRTSERCLPVPSPLFACDTEGGQLSCSTPGMVMRSESVEKTVEWTYRYLGIEGTWIDSETAVLLNRGTSTTAACSGDGCTPEDSAATCVNARTVAIARFVGDLDACGGS